MLTFRNMREMTKDEIKVFLREGRKIGCAVHTKEERQELLEALSRSKDTGFPQFVLVYEKDVLMGFLFIYGEEGHTWIIHNADEKTYEQEKEMLLMVGTYAKNWAVKSWQNVFSNSSKKWNAWEKAIGRHG